MNRVVYIELIILTRLTERGRILVGESAEEAIIREVFEETGVRLEVDRLGFIHENFFYGDYGRVEDK